MSITSIAIIYFLDQKVKVGYEVTLLEMEYVCVCNQCTKLAQWNARICIRVSSSIQYTAWLCWQDHEYLSEKNIYFRKDGKKNKRTQRTRTLTP